jgi:hypothetical protein
MNLVTILYKDKELLPSTLHDVEKIVFIKNPRMGKPQYRFHETRHPYTPICIDVEKIEKIKIGPVE